MKKLGILSTALLTAGILWADPSISLNRVQQRYPWNGKVDIDFTISEVPEAETNNYYVQFKLSRPGKPTLTLHEFEDDKILYWPKQNAEESAPYRVTWNSAWEDEDYRFFSTNVTIQAELVFCSGEKHGAPYGGRYEIFDFTNNTWWKTNFYDQAEANTFFNVDEYKKNQLVMRRIRSGSFTMGSPTDEIGREAIEAYGMETQHPVMLTKNFLLAIFPFTEGMAAQIGLGPFPEGKTWTAGGNYSASFGWNYKDLRGSNDPESKTTAESIMGKLSARTMKDFDLPTEAQWEYACRANTTDAPWGSVILEGGVVATNQYRMLFYFYNGGTAAVGTKANANPWGLFDMFGNTVYETCRDLIDRLDNYGLTGSAPYATQVDPLGNRGNGRILRGGYRWSHVYDLRAASRYRYTDTDLQISEAGFRPCCTLP